MLSTSSDTLLGVEGSLQFRHVRIGIDSAQEDRLILNRK